MIFGLRRQGESPEKAEINMQLLNNILHVYGSGVNVRLVIVLTTLTRLLAGWVCCSMVLIIGNIRAHVF